MLYGIPSVFLLCCDYYSRRPYLKFIEVKFKVQGCFRVSKILDSTTFKKLNDMKVGQKVRVATQGGRLMWVEP